MTYERNWNNDDQGLDKEYDLFAEGDEDEMDEQWKTEEEKDFEIVE